MILSSKQHHLFMKNHFSAALQCCGLCVSTAVPTTRSRQEDHKCLSPSASSAKTLLHTPLSSVHTHTRAHTHTHTTNTHTPTHHHTHTPTHQTHNTQHTHTYVASVIAWCASVILLVYASGRHQGS